jgi:hypothetical protein
MKKIVRSCLTALTLAAFASVTSVYASEWNYSLSAGVSYSDNVTRLAVSEIGASSAVVGAQLEARKNEGRLTYTSVGDVSYYEYLGSNIDGELLGQFQLQSAYSILPERLNWTFDGAYGQVREDLLRPSAPGNREGVISLATGPSMRFLLPATKTGDSITTPSAVPCR